MVPMYSVGMRHLDTKEFLSLENKARNRCEYFGLPFRDTLLPDKSVFIGNRLDFCPIDEQVLSDKAPA